MTLQEGQHYEEEDGLVHLVEVHLGAGVSWLLAEIVMVEVDIEQGAGVDKTAQDVAVDAALPDPPGGPQWEEKDRDNGVAED